MEVAVLLILVIVGCLWLITAASKRKTGDDSLKGSAQKPTPPRAYSAPKRSPPKPVQPRPFNAKTSHAAPPNQTVQGAAYIVDGDSLVIKKTQIRLFGVDAPELNHPYGQKAKWALVKLCKGQSIRAEISEIDHHGRTVAKCFLPDGRDLSAEMVKAGLALDWPKFSGGVYGALEVTDIRKKFWLADARQKGRMHVWQKFEDNKKSYAAKKTS